MRRVRPYAGPLVMVTGILVIMLATGEPDRDIAVRLWVVALGAVAVWAVVASLRAVTPSRRTDRFEQLTAQPVAAPGSVRSSIVRAERLISLAAGTAGDLHFRVRPTLRDIARSRLADHGLDLDDPVDSDEAARRCGPVLWEVVRPDRPTPDDRHAPGLPAAARPDLIDHLERL